MGLENVKILSFLSRDYVFANVMQFPRSVASLCVSESRRLTVCKYGLAQTS